MPRFQGYANGTIKPALPKVLIGVPYHGSLPGPFFQSLVALLEEEHRRTLEVQVACVPNTAVHLARDSLVRHFLRGPCDYLVMVDSDQVFAPAVVGRLISWKKPMVAPMIVARLGDPIPVAYQREGLDLVGNCHYTPLSEEVWAYLSQFDAERLRTPSVCLPLTPDRPPTMADLPEPVYHGLHSPLLAVDAVGCGMVCISRACLERIDAGPDNRYFDWERGGEDLSFCRRVLAAGYAGFDPFGEDRREPGIFVDRGCLVGHLAHYSRGATDLGHWLGRETATADSVAQAERLPVADLAEALAGDGARPTRGPWEAEPLPVGS